MANDFIQISRDSSAIFAGDLRGTIEQLRAVRTNLMKMREFMKHSYVASPLDVTPMATRFGIDPSQAVALYTLVDQAIKFMDGTSDPSIQDLLARVG